MSLASGPAHSWQRAFNPAFFQSPRSPSTDCCGGGCCYRLAPWPGYSRKKADCARCRRLRQLARPPARRRAHACFVLELAGTSRTGSGRRGTLSEFGTGVLRGRCDLLRARIVRESPARCLAPDSAQETARGRPGHSVLRPDAGPGEACGLGEAAGFEREPLPASPPALVDCGCYRRPSWACEQQMNQEGAPGRRPAVTTRAASLAPASGPVKQLCCRHHPAEGPEAPKSACLSRTASVCQLE